MTEKQTIGKPDLLTYRNVPTPQGRATIYTVTVYASDDKERIEEIREAVIDDKGYLRTLDDQQAYICESRAKVQVKEP